MQTPARANAGFRLLFERASVGIISVGADGRAIEANPAIGRMLGYRPAELVGMSLTEFTHPEDVDGSKRLYQELLEHERSSYQHEKRYIRKNGEVIWVRVTVWGDASAAESSQVAIAMIEDITEAKEAHGELIEKTNRLERIIATQRDISAAAMGDLEHVMQVIVERAQALTRAEGAMIHMIEGTDVCTRAACGIATRFLNNRRPLSQSVSRFAIAAREPVLIEYAENDPRLNAKLRKLVGDRSHICVPLFAGDRPVGALSVMSTSEVRRLNEEDRQTLELLAGVLSEGVSRAAEFEAKRRQVDALARFEAIYHGAITGVMTLSDDGQIVDANPAMCDMLGLENAHQVRAHIAEYLDPDEHQRVSVAVAELFSGNSNSLRIDTRLNRHDGTVVWVCASFSIVREPDGRPSFGIVMVQDDTERKAAEDALVRQSELNEHQALHDGLTGLPNRTLFRDRIEQAIAAARRENGQLAVAMMDLDRFKDVNDSLGHHAGDALLVELSQRLRGVLRRSDTVARLGGDEFGVLIPKPRTDRDVAVVIEKVRTALEQPVIVDGLALPAEASIGIAMFPEHGDDVDTLLRHADAAMYSAKDEKSGYVFYDGSRDETDPAQLTLVSELRRAIEERELVLYYQPKAALTDGAVESVEALLRWNHPTRGLVGPDEFIPLAQQTGLIKPLTLFVLDEALGQCRAWQRAGINLGVAINISIRNLLDAHFPELVRTLLDKWSVDPQLLELEITESTVLSDPVRTRRVLEKLSAMGVVLSIDDFGTGYSSLSYLSQLPVNEIKIDQSFVMNMTDCTGDAVIVRSTIDLARNLGLQVVAEGVETEEAWHELNELGCTLAQGYYLSRPVPAAELTDWLEHRRPSAGAGRIRRVA
ncbi:MAG TPA: EAL domain-containing protein [Solirubrobacteraceae bacterium]|nr:EAL domain-containing protein [Solirubrobacteraceae bacterium]